MNPKHSQFAPLRLGLRILFVPLKLNEDEVKENINKFHRYRHNEHVTYSKQVKYFPEHQVKIAAGSDFTFNVALIRQVQRSLTLSTSRPSLGYPHLKIIEHRVSYGKPPITAKG